MERLDNVLRYFLVQPHDRAFQIEERVPQMDPPNNSCAFAYNDCAASIRTRTSGPSRRATSVSDDYALVQDVIPLLHGQAASCATLFITAPDAPLLATLVEGIRDISFPDMRDKRLTALGAKAMVDQPTLGGIPGPRCNPCMLRLRGVGLSWANTTRIHYGNISTLSLHFLGSEAAPLVYELHSLLAHATALERMSIHGVHVTGMCIVYKVAEIYV
jgi:hypothetical protein